MNLIWVHHKDLPGWSDMTSSLVGIGLCATLYQANHKVIVAMAWVSMCDESRMQGRDFAPIAISIEL
jgi:hypothetical protein